jgi:hypothetical protein
MSEHIITINKIELASELANNELESSWGDSIQILKDENAEVLEYTDEAQDIFNDLYDKYLNIIEMCKE